MGRHYFFVEAVVHYIHEDNKNEEKVVEHRGIHTVSSDILSSESEEEKKTFFDNLIWRLEKVVKEDFENASGVFKINEVKKVEIKNISKVD